MENRQALKNVQESVPEDDRLYTGCIFNIFVSFFLFVQGERRD